MDDDEASLRDDDEASLRDDDEASLRDDDDWDLALRDGDDPGVVAGWSRRGRVGLVATAAVAVGALVVLVLLRPTAPAPVTTAPVRGVSLTVNGGQVVATYRVDQDPQGSSYDVDGVTGPGLSEPAAQTVARQAESDATVVTVTAVPDCRVVGLQRPAGPYLVAVTRTDVDGRQARGRVPVAGSRADWASAVQQVCWTTALAGAVAVTGVEGLGQPGGSVLDLAVTLRSALSQDVQVRVVDIADVATVDAADVAVLGRAASHAFRVRVPVTDCLAPGPVATALHWSVGPVGADPVIVLATPLSPQARTTLVTALRRACEPPGTTVTVAGARALPSVPGTGQRADVSVAVDLAVRSSAEQLLLGSDTSVLTADTRVTFTPAEVRPVGRQASASVIWHARCTTAGSQQSEPPLLPVWVRGAQGPTQYAVTLDDPRLEQARAEACRRR